MHLFQGDTMPVKYVRKEINKTKGDPKHARWSTMQKMQAVTTYMALGNLDETARQCGIPRLTLQNWKNQDWWKKAVEEVKEQSQQELQGTLGNLIKKSLKSLEDRLDNGDYIYVPRLNRIQRIPVSAQVLGRTAGDLLSRQAMLERIKNHNPQTTETINENLKRLREEFLKFSQAKQIEATIEKHDEPETTPLRALNGPVVDSTVVEATTLHGQPKEGLEKA